MKNYKELEQKSLEWHEMKWGKIGGTLSKGLFIKSDTLLIEILSQRLEDFEMGNDFESDAMAHGNEFEPFAIEWVESYTGFKFERTGWLQSEENELLGISPDAISEDETTCCEVKCFGRKKHTEVILTNEIPLDNLNQLLHYFTVNPKLQKLYYCAFRSESVKNFIKELTPDSEINLGTKAKPIIKPISEWVKIAKAEADLLLEQIITKEEQLKTI